MKKIKYNPYSMPTPKLVWRNPFIEVILTRGMTALIDPEDFQKIKENGPWRVQVNGNRFYAYGKRDWKISMHRLIMGYPKYPDFVVDQKNGDVLDNRKSNLRIVTPRENLINNIRHRKKYGVPK